MPVSVEATALAVENARAADPLVDGEGFDIRSTSAASFALATVTALGPPPRGGDPGQARAADAREAAAAARLEFVEQGVDTTLDANLSQFGVHRFVI